MIRAIKVGPFTSLFLLTALFAAGIIVGLFAMNPRANPKTQVGRLGIVSLDGVDLNALHVGALSPPPEGYVPKIDSYSAETALSGGEGGARAKQILLAHLETSFWGGFDGEVWIVNFDPEDVHLFRECRGEEVIFAVSFVDAQSGRELFGVSSSKPPAGCGGPLGSDPKAPLSSR